MTHATSRAPAHLPGSPRITADQRATAKAFAKLHGWAFDQAMEQYRDSQGDAAAAVIEAVAIALRRDA